MGKVKNMAWDEAETYLDNLITKIKNKTMTIAEAIAAERPALIDVDMIDTAKLPRPFVGKAAWAIPHEDLLP